MKELLYIMILAITLCSCNTDKELKDKQKSEDSLKNIQKLELAKILIDRGSERMKVADYYGAVESFQDVLTRYSDTKYVSEAKEKIEKCNQLLVEQCNQVINLSDLLSDLNEIEEAILFLNEYIKKSQKQELTDRVKEHLSKLEPKFQIILNERLSNVNSHLQIISIGNDNEIQRISTPVLIKVKNIGNANIGKLSVKIQWVNETTKSILGEETTEISSLSTPLEPDFTKEIEMTLKRETKIKSDRKDDLFVKVYFSNGGKFIYFKKLPIRSNFYTLKGEYLEELGIDEDSIVK